MEALTRSAARRCREREMLQEKVVQWIRSERVKQAQDEEVWIYKLNISLKEDLTMLSAAEARKTAMIAPYYEVEEDGVLFFWPRSTPTDTRAKMMRPVIP